GPGHGVRGLYRRDDALGAGEEPERVHGLDLGHRLVDGPAGPGEPGVFGADAGRVEARGAGGGGQRLPGLVLPDGGAGAVEDAGTAGADGGRVAERVEPLTCGLEAVERHRRVVDEVREHADGVRTAPDAGGDVVGKAAVVVDHLGAGLGGDDALQFADD